MSKVGLFFLKINGTWEPAVTAFLCALLIAGCASLGGTYPEDKGDICANQRGDLRRTEDYFLKQGITNVLGGAAIGAASGAIIAAISGGNIGKGAAIGAAAGTGAGLLKTLYDNLNRENQQIDMATSAFNNLGQCRFNAAELVRSDFRSKRVSEVQARSKMSDLKVRFNEDVVIANRIGAKISERSTEFQNNLVKEDPNVGPYLAAVRTENAQTNIDSPKEAGTSVTAPESQARGGKKGGRRGHIPTRQPKPGSNQNTVVNKDASKAQITSPESRQAASATETNIVKSKQYNDTVKSMAQKESFQLEGQVGLFLSPKIHEAYPISWLEGQDKQCSVLFL